MLGVTVRDSMALTRQQQRAIVEGVYERKARGEPYLTPRLAAESRRRKEIAQENSLPHPPAPNASVPPLTPRTPNVA